MRVRLLFSRPPTGCAPISISFSGCAWRPSLAVCLVLMNRGRRAQIVAAMGSIPGIAGPMRDRRTARIIGTLGLLVANGVALPAALKILRDVISEPRFVTAIDQRARPATQWSSFCRRTRRCRSPSAACSAHAPGRRRNRGSCDHSRACITILRTQARHRPRPLDGSHRAGDDHSGKRCHRSASRVHHECAPKHHGTCTMIFCVLSDPRAPIAFVRRDAMRVLLWSKCWSS